MKESTKQSPNFVRAQRQVNNIKKFYRHLSIYVVINGILLIAKFKLFDFFTEQGIRDEGFYEWLDWNIIGTPIIWGVGLLLHGIYVFRLNAKPLKDFKPTILKEWEAKQLKKFLREEEQNDKLTKP